jgi:Cohesin domain/Carboxypeptidase regulatory-like domain
VLLVLRVIKIISVFVLLAFAGVGAYAQAIPVSLPNASGGTGFTVTIPITVGDVTGRGVIAYQFNVTFDPNVVQPASTPYSTTGTMTAATPGYSVTVNPDNPGSLRFAVFGTQPLTGSGTLLNLRFNIVGHSNSPTAGTPLTWTAYMFNEGNPASSKTSGSITVIGPTAAGVSVAGRVRTAEGYGISKALVTITGADGQSRSVLTSPFGYFRFDDIAAGSTYTITTAAKLYTFATHLISPQDNINDLDITAD